MSFNVRFLDYLRTTPAWLLAILTAIFSLILLFSIGYPLDKVTWNDFPIGPWIAYFVMGIFVAGACYLICHFHPSDYLAVCLLSNALSIFAAVIEPNFWRTDLWQMNLLVWIMSVAACWRGAQAGRKNKAG